MKKWWLLLCLLVLITACSEQPIVEEPQAELIEEMPEEPVAIIEEPFVEEPEEEPQATIREQSCSITTSDVTQDVELDQDLADEFGSVVDQDNFNALFDSVTQIQIDNVDNTYSIEEEIRFASGFGPQTTLSFDKNDKFGDDIFIPVARGDVSYYLTFKDDLKEDNRITGATASDSIVIPFLGQDLEIISASNNALTVIAPTKYRVKAGQTIHINGDTVTLIQTQQGSATVEVNGQREVITNNNEERVNGIEVLVTDISFDEGLEYDEATLIIGTDASTTVSDGEAYFDQDSDDPLWTWVLEGLNSANPTIGVTFAQSLDSPDEGPIYEGSALCLPNQYVCIVYKSTNTKDYRTFNLETGTKDLYASQADVANSTIDVTGAKVLEFDSTGKGFSYDSDKTEKVFIYHTGTQLQIYAERENQAVLTETITGSGTPFTLIHGNANVPVDFTVSGTTATMVLDFPVGDDLTIYFETDGTDRITYLGHSQGDTDTADDILYGSTDISGFEEDVRLGSGAILEDPEGHENSDDLTLFLPDRINDFSIEMMLEMTRVTCV